MKRLFVITTLVAGLALAGAASAQGMGGGRGPGMGPGTGPGAGMGPGANRAAGLGLGTQLQQRLQLFDTNKDGLIQRTEMLQWRERVMARMDANADGQLTREEYLGVQMGRGANPANRGPRYDENQAAKAAEFTAMDKDGDGVIPAEDFIGYMGAWFDRGDRDRNGALTAAEFRAMHQQR